MGGDLPSLLVLAKCLRMGSMKKIFFLAHYDFPDSAQKRYRAPAACTKIEYICETIAKLGYQVELISASNTLSGSLAPSNRNMCEGVNVCFLRGYRRGGRFCNKFSTGLFYINLLFHLLKTIKKEDTVIAYHSLILMQILSFVKKVKHCRLILEVEEIYGDVIGNPKIVGKELDFFRCADAYIFPTQLLDQKVNEHHKPSVIVHGTYKVEPDRGERFNDDLIHVVYAGTFDPRKGGVAAAAAAAEFLPANYHMHILGFGSEQDVQTIKNKISDVAQKSKARITYEGLLSGEEYIRFLQKCHIGLSTQNPNADFNDTSFPSKILSYMSNGLRVVSIRIPVVEMSAVGRTITFYDKQTPEKLASAIISLANVEYDERENINLLDKVFSKELNDLLKEMLS